MNYEIKDCENGKRIDIFNENWYKVDEETFYPSVTFVQGFIVEPQLANWYKEVGLQANQIMETAKGVGSAFHAAVESLLKFGRIDWFEAMEDMRVWNRVCNFAKFYEKHLKSHKIISIETQCFNHDEYYAGTVDLLTKDENGLHIWDWKSSKAVQHHHKSQVSAYAKCYGAVASANVVIFPEFPTTKQGYSLTSLTPELIDYNFEYFLWLKKGFDMEYKEPKFKTLPYEIKLEDICK
jgi:hypothetical protein